MAATRIPDSVNMSDLIKAANEIDVLNAPINDLFWTDENIDPPKHVAKDMVDKIERFRNLIHRASALKDSYDPRTFTPEQLNELTRYTPRSAQLALLHRRGAGVRQDG